MKTQSLKKLPGNAITLIAIIALLSFSSLEKNDPDASCCSGYSIQVPNLKKFMIDSLNKIQFEGGVYSRADLLSVINILNAADDSVYIMNTLVNCDVAQGTDLALTSKHTPGVQFLKGKKPCHGCPNKPCCRTIACVAKIKRNCLTYIPYTPPAPSFADRQNTSGVYSSVAANNQ